MNTEEMNATVTKANIKNASDKTKQLKRLAVLFAILSETREQLEETKECPALLHDIDDLQDRWYPKELHELVEDMTEIIGELLVVLPEGVLKDDINGALGFLKEQATVGQTTRG